MDSKIDEGCQHHSEITFKAWLAGCPNLEVVQLTLRTCILHWWLKTQFESFHSPLHCLQ